MKKYISKKWKQLTQEQQQELLKKCKLLINVNATKGKCVINFHKKLAIAGNIIDSNDCTELQNYDLSFLTDNTTYRVKIDKDAIFYNPEKDVIVENPKFQGLIALKDAAMLYNKEESTLRRNIANGFFKEWQDCIKFGNTWVFDIDALERKYNNVE
jgi:hypothetical protein